MSTTQTQTQTIMVIAPNRDAEEVVIEPGMTVGQLAEQLGLPDGARMPAVDEMQRTLSPTDVISPEVEALSWVFKLSGAC